MRETAAGGSVAPGFGAVRDGFAQAQANDAGGEPDKRWIDWSATLRAAVGI
jgi:hypothetical protein